MGRITGLLLFFLCFSQIVRSQVAYVSQETKSGMVTVTSLERIRTNKNRVINSKNVQRVLNDSVKFKGIDIFLVNEKRADEVGVNYIDVFKVKNTDNYFKKINDSLYEVYIVNPEKEVFFAQQSNSYLVSSLYGSMTGGLNSPEVMGGRYDSLIIIANGKNEAYEVTPFNPFLYGLELRIGDQISGRNMVVFKILFQFPQPKLIGLIKDSLAINKKKQNPSTEWHSVQYDSLNMVNQKRLVIKKGEPLVFYFEHFGGFCRRDYMDNLFYKLDSAADWTLTPLAYNPSILLENLKPGKHTLYVKYPVDEAPAFTYEFEVAGPVSDSPYWWALMGILFSGIAFYFIYKTRLRNAKERAQKTRLELQSIQSQLNPHFMFNALGSVQYLMNNNEKEKADHYLTEFSSLLRSSLSNNENEMVPLSKELQVLNSYVNLEQLRFNFQHQLHIDKEIDPGTVSIPTLLIQPLVENAIKHGISPLRENGLLEIAITQQGNNLLLSIKDNGRGFADGRLFSGLGTKLVKERIDILKRSHFNIELSFTTNQVDETKILLKFTDWL